MEIDDPIGLKASDEFPDRGGRFAQRRVVVLGGKVSIQIAITFGLVRVSASLGFDRRLMCSGHDHQGSMIDRPRRNDVSSRDARRFVAMHATEDEHGGPHVVGDLIQDLRFIACACQENFGVLAGGRRLGCWRAGLWVSVDQRGLIKKRKADRQYDGECVQT